MAVSITIFVVRRKTERYKETCRGAKTPAQVIEMAMITAITLIAVLLQLISYFILLGLNEFAFEFLDLRVVFSITIEFR